MQLIYHMIYRDGIQIIYKDINVAQRMPDFVHFFLRQKPTENFEANIFAFTEMIFFGDLSFSKVMDS